MGAGEGCHGCTGGRTLSSYQARRQSESKLKLQHVFVGVFGKTAHRLNAALQVRNGLGVSRTNSGSLAGSKPILHRLCDESGLGEMVRQSFGLSLYDLLEILLESIGDRTVKLGASAL